MSRQNASRTKNRAGIKGQGWAHFLKANRVHQQKRGGECRCYSEKRPTLDAIGGAERGGK